MLAMLLDAPGRGLRRASTPIPQAGAGQLLLRVRACGVCRTDLHVADGELPGPKLPLVSGWPTSSALLILCPSDGSERSGST